MKTTKAQSKTAQRKRTKQSVAQREHSFVPVLGFILLGVLIGMLAIQAVESKWLQSNVATPALSATCYRWYEPLATPEDHQSYIKCCSQEGNETVDCVKDATRLRNESPVVQEQRTKNEENLAENQSQINQIMSNTEKNKTNGSTTNAASSDNSAGKVYSTEAECKASGCKNCVLKDQASTGSVTQAQTTDPDQTSSPKKEFGAACQNPDECKTGRCYNGKCDQPSSL